MQTIDHHRCPPAGGPSGATLVKTVRGILPVLLVWCAGAQAQPAAPDSVWSDEECWTLATVDQTYGQGARICLCWTTVEEADAYRIWREIMVTQGLDEDGNLVELDTPKPAWVAWGGVDRPEDQGPILCAVIASLDGDATRLGVSSVQDEESSETTGAGDPATAVRRTRWGRVKESLRGAAAPDWRRR